MDSSNRASATPTPPGKAEAAAASSSSRASRGSTPTASKSASRLVRPESKAESPARVASRDSLKQKKMSKVDELPRPNKAEEVGLLGHLHETNTHWRQQLKALKAEFDGLRSHLTCKICDRLLYQPYTIACGHTYCYSVRKQLHQSYQVCPD